MKKVFIVADSISIHYHPYLKKMAQGVFDYGRKEGILEALKDMDNADVDGANGGDSSMVLEYLRRQFEKPDFNPDYLVLNCGLHDVKIDPDTNKKQISQQQYKENLEQVLELARNNNTNIIWINSTPIDDNRHNTLNKDFLRFNKDVIQYNKIAGELFKDAGCPIIDLYDFTSKLNDDLYCDHAHYNEPVREKQAYFIAGYISAILAQ